MKTLILLLITSGLFGQVKIPSDAGTKAEPIVTEILTKSAGAPVTCDNAKKVPLDGYAPPPSTWKEGDVVEIEFAVPPNPDLTKVFTMNGIRALPYCCLVIIKATTESPTFKILFSFTGPNAQYVNGFGKSTSAAVNLLGTILQGTAVAGVSVTKDIVCDPKAQINTVEPVSYTIKRVRTQ